MYKTGNSQTNEYYRNSKLEKQTDRLTATIR